MSADALAQIELPYVQAFRDRHGRQRWYYRRRGYGRVALPEPGSPGFLAAYEAANGKPRGEGAGQERTHPGSIAALVVAYYATAEWSQLRPSTQRDYRYQLDAFRTAHGAKRVATIEPKHVEAIIHAVGAKPGAALNLRKRLRRIFTLAERLGWRPDNPVKPAQKSRQRSEGHVPWSEDDIARFEARWPSGTRERLALALLLCTGQRRSDVVTMGRQHVRDGRIQVKQIKTGARLAIRIHQTLQREIDGASPGMTFLLTSFGKPFSAAGFTLWFVERARAAGLEGRTPHGLRKAAGRRLAEAGCTAKEIAAVLGHKSLAEVETYTRDADQRVLADAAMGKIGGVP
jgi:integrase